MSKSKCGRGTPDCRVKGLHNPSDCAQDFGEQLASYKNTNCLGYHGEEKRAIPGCQCAKPTANATEATFEEQAKAIVAEDRRTEAMTLDELLAQVRRFAVIGCGGDPKSLASIAARRILRLCDETEQFQQIVNRARQVISINHLNDDATSKAYMACVRWILFEDDPEVERAWGYDV